MTTTLIVSLGVSSLAYLLFLLIVVRKSATGDAPLTLSEFFVSGRDIGLWRAVATIGATEIGIITIAYNAQKGFNEGFVALSIGVAALIGCLLVGLTGFIVRPLRRTGVLTIPEFYGQRYGQDVRVFGAIIMALGGILNMGLFLKVASGFLVALLGIEDGATYVNALMIVLIVMAVAYTCFGGMRSVIMTDVFQFVLIAVGLIVALFVVLSTVSFGEAVEVVQSKKGDGGFDPLISQNFGFEFLMWMVLVAGVVSSAIWPTALSRALCIKEERDVSRAYLISSIAFMGRIALPVLLGVLAYTFFELNGYSPRLTGFGDDADLAATPVFLAEVLPAWLVGGLIVAMFASFMSTQDGYLFCWASILARDVAGPIMKRTEDVSFQVKATRIGIVVIALYELYWGLIYSGKEDIWDYLAVSGSIYFCSGIVLLAGGLYWKGATRRGAIVALICGFSSIAGLGPLKSALGLEAVSAPTIGFAAIALSVVGFILGSLSERRAT